MFFFLSILLVNNGKVYFFLIKKSRKKYMYFCFMRIDIITLHPELLEGPFSASILKRAIDKKIVQIVVHQLRDYSN